VHIVWRSRLPRHGWSSCNENAVVKTEGQFPVVFIAGKAGLQFPLTLSAIRIEPWTRNVLVGGCAECLAFSSLLSAGDKGIQ
jgi:hypothetical protein